MGAASKEEEKFWATSKTARDFFSIASKVGTRVNSLLLKKKLNDMDRKKTKHLILPSISGQD